ncbi:cyclophilin-like family protein [Clostridioides difficile CD160]|nr:cyclophilin-like family protein [Clostridioides difficile CD160]
MKKLILCVCILCFIVSGYNYIKITNTEKEAQAKLHKENVDTKQSEEMTNIEDINKDNKMKIQVSGNGNTIVYELNDSQAAKDLYAQLPLTMEVENFSTNEKVFYPPKKLNTTDTPMANADKGTLAYYSPWDDVVMFYDYSGSGSNLYELGVAISGEDYIDTLSKTIKITVQE